MQYGRRKGPPWRLIFTGSAILAIGLVAATFWFAHKAESNPPEQRDIRVEAQNVGPR